MNSTHILIVDDHEMIRRGIRSLLAARPDWTVHEAADGMDAVEKALALRPRIVLMDISMPRMSGLEATRIIRKEIPQTDIIFVSQIDPALARTGTDVVTGLYISKMNLSKELLPTIELLLGPPTAESSDDAAAEPAQARPAASAGSSSSDSQPAPSSDLEAAITARFGLLPNFFRLSPETPEIRANLWGFAQMAYLDNPLPSLFKERLFVYLSRFCEARYCVARHLGFLMGLGRPSGDAKSPLCSAEDVVRLLRRPLSRGEDLAARIARCAKLGALAELPAAATQLEEDIFALATHVFLQTQDAPACLAALGALLRERRLQYLLLFLSFIRTAHYWTRIHPELVMETDIVALLQRHEELAECVMHDPEARSDPLGRTILTELAELRHGSASASLLAAIVDSSDDAIVSKTLDGTITSWNHGAQRMFGYTPDEAIGRHITMLIPSERWDEEAEIIAQVKRGERVDHFETVRLRKDGTTFNVSVTISPVRDALNNIVGASKVARDITQRKYADRANALLAAIVDSSDDAIVSKTLDGVITSWNQGAVRMFGYTPEEAVGQNIKIVIPHDRLDEEASILRQLRQGQRIENFETVRRRKDGSEIEISLTISPVRDASGEIIGASKMAHDISRRKKTERALAEQARLLDLANDAILIRSPNDRIIYWNRAATELYGYKMQEALGRVSHELLRTEFPISLKAIEQHIQREGRWSGELLHTRKDGTRIIVNSRWSLDRDTHGNPASTLETNTDVTDRKRFEERLRESEHKYRAVFDSIDEGFCIIEKVPAKFGHPVDFRYVAANPMFAVHAGKGDVVGKTIREVFPGEPEEWMETYQRILRTGEPLRFERGLVTQGKVLEVYAVRIPDGTDLRLAVVFNDVTGRKRDEETLRENERRFRELADQLDAQVRLRTLQLEQRNREVNEQADQLRRLSQRLLQMQDAERRHVARELHDSAGQTLTVLAMYLGRIVNDAKQSAPAMAALAMETQELVRQLSKEIRTTSYLLHPPLLDESGLSSALRWYAQGLEERSGIEIELNLPDDLERLPREMELAVFRLVQEALTNVHRHSGSKTARIRLSRENEAVSVEIRDEGKGIPEERFMEIQSQGTGVGLRGMRERVRQFGGEMRIESNAAGTVLSFQLHIPPPAPNPEASLNSATAVSASASASAPPQMQ